MIVLAVMNQLGSFDIARIIVLLQGMFLTVLLAIRIWQVYVETPKQEVRFMLMPYYSWLLLIMIGTYDTFTRIGDGDIQWWRTPIRAVAYAIGIAGLLYYINRNKTQRRLPRQDSNLQPSG